MEGLALICRTTNTECCRAMDNNTVNGTATGNWILPNGNEVIGRGSSQNALTFRNRGTRIVRLNVQTGAAVITGRFCCMIPDNDGVTQTLCVDVTLGKLVFIT